MTQKGESVTLILIICGEAAITTLGPKGRCSLSGSEHNPSTQPAALAAPLFIICGEAATTTLAPKARQT